MVALTAPEDIDTAIEVLAGHGVRAWVAGEVRRRSDAGRDGGRVVLRASTPAGDRPGAGPGGRGTVARRFGSSGVREQPRTGSVAPTMTR